MLNRIITLLTDPALQLYEYEKALNTLRGSTNLLKPLSLHSIYVLDHPDHTFSKALTDLIPVLLDKLGNQ